MGASLVSGLVHDEQNKAIAMARVSFVHGPGSLPDIAALTDTRGAFMLSVGLPGSYVLECMADGFQSSRIQVSLSSDLTAQITFRLIRSG
jgi:Carboxypeptidase regulatory-like domain